MSARPDFEIVCDHNINDGPLHHVARYVYISDETDPSYHPDGNWRLPLQFSDVRVTLLDGDRKVKSHLGEEVKRVHFEIVCQTVGCSRRPYRSDEVNLQNLFTLIADTPEFRTVIAANFSDSTFTDTEIVLKLDALHAARDTARSYGLQV